MILERIFRDGIGAACAGAIGFITLIIAHHLAVSGDTMEMLQAVLDTNIWLATHVVVITTGYASMFFAGLLAIIYVMRGVFTKSLSPETRRFFGANGLRHRLFRNACSVSSERCLAEFGPINRGDVSGVGTRRKTARCSSCFGARSFCTRAGADSFGSAG